MNVWFGYSLAATDTIKRFPIELRAFAHEADAIAWKNEWEWLTDMGVLKTGAQRIVQVLEVEEGNKTPSSEDAAVGNEISAKDVYQKLGEIFPNFQIEKDLEGQIVVYTGMKEGKERRDENNFPIYLEEYINE